MWDTDESLVHGMEQKSKQAFQLFYERYIDYVYRIVIGVVKNHDQALDICQDLFLEYFQKAHTFDPERGSVKAWVAVRARSRSVDYIRQSSKEVTLHDQEYEKRQAATTPQDEFLKKEESQHLVQLLFKLPAHQRNAIVDNYVHSLTHQEIAKKLDKPLGTVKSTIRYGIQKLRKYYTSDNVEKDRGDSIDEQSFNR
ncbi:RNA polymerase sigma factor [Tenuibacillus multivorans]|uniref:RNA polymerase sigma-70 factor, ECF subfamily n=1 Tax=Tenuibacillus multivorans TaxID=237069 RepID=A0A1H0C3K9_9BACI|nr:RNA polymerase sigma factor [Tenuibacillus multivorans]GEL77753.1 RNA polymerase sigma factor RpoE [Tenuibacillus multivorans]SDN52432.1 RNA polymerase sigma-70 factor, ECF subfamily [Tenuibacillus multivorans]